MIKKLLSFTLAALTAASVSSSLASFGTANVRSLLKEDSLVVYDEDLGYLKGIFPDTAVKAFKSNFISDITVKDASGNAALCFSKPFHPKDRQERNVARRSSPQTPFDDFPECL